MANPFTILPLEAASLVNIPAEHKPKYSPKLSGDGFWLEYLASTDTAEIEAYTQEISDGRVVVMPDNETPTSLREKAAADNAARDAFLSGVDEQWNAILAQRQAEDEKKLREMLAAIDANYSRWKRQ